MAPLELARLQVQHLTCQPEADEEQQHNTQGSDNNLSSPNKDILLRSNKDLCHSSNTIVKAGRSVSWIIYTSIKIIS